MEWPQSEVTAQLGDRPMEAPMYLNVSQTCLFPLCLGATALRRDVFHETFQIFLQKYRLTFICFI